MTTHNAVAALILAILEAGVTAFCAGVALKDGLGSGLMLWGAVHVILGCFAATAYSAEGDNGPTDQPDDVRGTEVDG